LVVSSSLPTGHVTQRMRNAAMAVFVYITARRYIDENGHCIMAVTQKLVNTDTCYLSNW